MASMRHVSVLVVLLAVGLLAAVSFAEEFERPEGTPAWAMVGQAQCDAAKAAGLPVAVENAFGMRLLLVPAGEFTMGSPAEEPGRGDDEGAHTVKLAKPFYVLMTEVTNGQYRRFVADHDSGVGGNEDRHPAVKVTYAQAVAYAAWLSKQDPKHAYRLPTEAEWEYAARAGTTTRFPWGESEAWTGRYANVADQTSRWEMPLEQRKAVEAGEGWQWFDTEDGFAHVAPTGWLRPNPWGIHDMLGNVSEWCSDRYGAYGAEAATDPKGPADGNEHVLRGGSWKGTPAIVRCAKRSHAAPTQADALVGFRLVATPVASAPAERGSGSR